MAFVKFIAVKNPRTSVRAIYIIYICLGVIDPGVELERLRSKVHGRNHLRP